MQMHVLAKQKKKQKVQNDSTIQASDRRRLARARRTLEAKDLSLKETQG
jgi:hypothetical protein